MMEETVSGKSKEGLTEDINPNDKICKEAGKMIFPDNIKI
jgi:hypothetical protein